MLRHCVATVISASVGLLKDGGNVHGHVGVPRFAMGTPIDLGDLSSDEGAPVSYLGYIFVVPKRQHEFVAHLGVLVDGESLLLGIVREPIPWETESYNVETGVVRGSLDEKR